METSASRSYWQETTPVFPLSRNLPGNAEVAVIGGGLLGVSTCYWLARRGAHPIVLERIAIGHGATGRNGGFVVAGPTEGYIKTIEHVGYETARAILTVTLAGKNLLQQVVQEETISCEYKVTDSIRLILTEEQFSHYQSEVNALQSERYPAFLLDRSQVQEYINTPLSDEILGGRCFQGQGTVHSTRFIQGLLQAAQRYGAQAYQAEVLKVTAENDQVRLHTTNGEIQAQAVVIAVNAWTSCLIPLEDIVLPVREQMLAYEPIEPVFPAGFSVRANTDEYWQQRPDGTILIGGCGSAAPNSDMGVWDQEPSQIVQQTLEQILPRLFPTLGPLQVKQRWAGLLDSTTDSNPIVDQVPDIPHALFVCGFSGHGMPFGMRFGQLLAEAVTSGKLPAELRPYRRDRPTLKRWDNEYG